MEMELASLSVGLSWVRICCLQSSEVVVLWHCVSNECLERRVIR